MAGLRGFACVLGALIAVGCSSATPSSPGGQGGAVCGCGGGLAIDVQGDGDPLHLTSADYDASWRSSDDLHISADITPADNSSGDFTVLTECLDLPRPWAQSTSGEGSVVFWVQACAGPGDAPPCIWFAYDKGYSRYVDRDGRSFFGDLQQLKTTFQSFKTNRGESIDGQFTMVLYDGRTLTGTFRVCVLATINFA